MFYSRSAWGAQVPNRQSPDRATTTHLHVHHSATLNPTSTPRPDDIEEAKEQWRAFQTDHLGRTVTLPDGTVINWADLAYNIGIGPGVVLEGRGWDVKGGGTGPGQRVVHPSGSWDNVSVSICVIGNYQDEQLDPLTRATLVAALAEAHARYGDLTVMVDRDVNFTSCCGDNLIALVPQLWAEATAEPPGDDMPTPEEIWNHPLTKDGQTFPAWQWLLFLHDEMTNPELLEARIAETVASDGGVVSGGATPGQVAEEIGRRLREP